MSKRSRASQRAAARRSEQSSTAGGGRPAPPAGSGGPGSVQIPFRTSGGGDTATGGAAGASTASSLAGSRRTAGPTTRPTSERRSRPARTYRDTRPFLERHRVAVLGIGVLAIVLVVSGFVFFQATQPLYACSTVFDDPAASTPSGAPQPDRGKTHLQPGTFEAYDFCPPASGPHNTTSQFGPIQPRYYAPDEQTVPQGWVHNLEHGALVVLYKCTGDVCGDATQNQLKQFVASFPNSPVCGVKPGVVSPVVTRFDQLPHTFAAVVWDRVMYMDTWDPQRALDFYARYGETLNPEPQCARASPSPSAGASPTASGSPPASTAPSASAS